LVFRLSKGRLSNGPVEGTSRGVQAVHGFGGFHDSAAGPPRVSTAATSMVGDALLSVSGSDIHGWHPTLSAE
jgi:hypothetical protein